ncbi:LysR family transcriptional regulator [Gammaproteobacteria bacterium]|jgi:DNA-binding transcriptional LysR family regulator|nr:LysR family transcriptional regulator [Gammaproteobacteria bacterium]MDA8799360.1 LysR family transcriptional regulator [Gammaproteobacteria bacterium]MDA9935910.1 LysR family transcriptional regulator [Gammaproteobacteria bacterium]MDC0918903.1 LysR family transcriptional regulator [Gammaproteobacteria bacterium]|tara:strand:+ start:282 stop:1142 length:861 start_codon:yes stop_codon:yes gene_type:complete
MLWSHLEFFLATARHGTLSAAAKELNVNHTTVARRIGSLEKEFQVKLFKRKNTGYALTEHGANLLAEVRNIEEMINQTKSKFISTPENIIGKLSVARTTDSNRFNSVLKRFQDSYPNVELSSYVGTSESQIKSYEADVTILTTRYPPQDMVAKKIGTTEMHIYGSKNYLKDKDTKDLESLDWLSFRSDSVRPNTFDLIRRSVKNPNIKFASDSYSEILEFTLAGSGVAFLADLDVESKKDMQIIAPQEHHQTVHIWLVFHPDLVSNPRVQAFKKFIIDNANVVGIN